MGQNGSMPQPPSISEARGRTEWRHRRRQSDSRSKSPLPRYDHPLNSDPLNYEDGENGLAQYPSTMPIRQRSSSEDSNYKPRAATQPEFTRARGVSPDVDPRYVRARGESPVEPPRPSTQPRATNARLDSSDDSPRHASQPEPSSRKRKRKSSIIKAENLGDSASKKKRKKKKKRESVSRTREDESPIPVEYDADRGDSEIIKREREDDGHASNEENRHMSNEEDHEMGAPENTKVEPKGNGYASNGEDDDMGVAKDIKVERGESRHASMEMEDAQDERPQEDGMGESVEDQTESSSGSGMRQLSSEPGDVSPDPIGAQEAYDDYDGDQELPEADKIDVASTPPPSSAKTPGSRKSHKLKPKIPFFERESEENAQAFVELPPDDAIVPTRTPRARKTKTVKKEKKGKKSKKSVDEDESMVGDPEDDEVQATQGHISKSRRSAFSAEEQARIIAAVEQVRQNENMTQEQINEAIHANPQQRGEPVLKQLWSSIAEACPSKPRRKLQHWCRLKFNNYVARGTWTKEQDDELAQLIAIHGQKWSEIGGMIKRYPGDIRDRYRNYLVCRGTVKTDYWSEEEEARLRKAVEEAMGRIQEDPAPTSMAMSANGSAENLINWQQISQAMGRTRTRLQCIEKWKRLRAADKLIESLETLVQSGSGWRVEKTRRDLRKMTDRDKLTLVRAIRNSKVGTDTRIPWKSIVDDTFEGTFERRALLVAWGRLKQTVPDWESKTTLKCANRLCHIFKKDGAFTDAADDEVLESEVDDDDRESGLGEVNGGNEPVDQADSIVSSDMEDMEDIPARLSTAANGVH
ncbi:hypothetical protein B0H63DRAFT_472073 [Podospora didyma]|uniref:DNA-binding protein n=1 Tax=Podospora didyma TaxID=330526 RepID=A0AAE0TZB2_9PEZI|nr:hypothetical protein B0H63DRAFT_472073 [Podospora didyma]